MNTGFLTLSGIARPKGGSGDAFAISGAICIGGAGIATRPPVRSMNVANTAKTTTSDAAMGRSFQLKSFDFELFAAIARCNNPGGKGGAPRVCALAICATKLRQNSQRAKWD